MGKISKAGRKPEQLVETNLVPLLIRLSKSKLDKVSTNCSEALKNLSSNGDGGIEEGTVATLIQMSLSGPSAAAAAALDEDEHCPPIMLPIDEALYAPTPSLTPG